MSTSSSEIAEVIVVVCTGSSGDLKGCDGLMDGEVHCELNWVVGERQRDGMRWCGVNVSC
jgi:hypothetical protein